VIDLLKSLTPEHLAVLVVALVGLDWIAKRIRAAWKGAKDFVGLVLEEKLPETIKTTLRNGGGEIIRDIMRSENEQQSKLHKQELDQRFRDHEIDEQRRFTASATESKARFDAGEARFRAIEDDVLELAEVIKVRPTRSRRRRIR
jgi:hypothetical protein